MHNERNSARRTTLSDTLKQASKERAVTLMYGARDKDHNEATAYKHILEGRA